MNVSNLSVFCNLFLLTVFLLIFISSPTFFISSISDIHFSCRHIGDKKMSNSTKVFVTGAVHMAGTANKGTGDKYDFGTVTYLVPAQSFSNAHCTRTSAGFEPTTVNVSDKSIILRLQSVLDSPRELNLELAPDPLNVQRNICVGFSEIAPLPVQSVNDDTKKSPMKFGS